MDTLTIIIVAGLVTIVILVLFLRNIMLNNRITDTAIENDRLKRENKSLEKENGDLVDQLREQREQSDACIDSAESRAKKAESQLDEVTGGARRRSLKSDIYNNV